MKKLLDEIFGRASGKERQAAGFPYASFLHIFQPYSSLYTKHDLQSPQMPLMPEDDPVFIATGVLEGFGSTLGQDLASDPGTVLKDLNYIRSPQGDWVIYGEYDKIVPSGGKYEYVFLTIVGASPKGPKDDPDAPDYMYEPHFAFEAMIGYFNQQCLLFPLYVANLVRPAGEKESMIALMDFPGEFHKAICSADAAFCQVSGGQPLTVESNQTWLNELPDVVCLQKVAWLRERDFNGLQDQIVEQGGRLPALGRG